jgi:AICAR transformylase/IMP cyclohydrolase PurH
VYDKSGLIELAKGLHESGVRLLGSGGTAKKIREAGIAIQCVERRWHLAFAEIFELISLF